MGCGRGTGSRLKRDFPLHSLHCLDVDFGLKATVSLRDCRQSSSYTKTLNLLYEDVSRVPLLDSYSSNSGLGGTSPVPLDDDKKVKKGRESGDTGAE